MYTKMLSMVKISRVLVDTAIYAPGIFEKKIGEVMVKNPISIRFDAFAVEILKVVENKSIDDLPVVDADGKVVGLVDIQDLPGLKLM